MDKECWKIPPIDKNTNTGKSSHLEALVTKVAGNCGRAMDRIAPLKMKNLKSIEELQSKLGESKYE